MNYIIVDKDEFLQLTKEWFGEGTQTTLSIMDILGKNNKGVYLRK